MKKEDLIPKEQIRPYAPFNKSIYLDLYNDLCIGDLVREYKAKHKRMVSKSEVIHYILRDYFVRNKI